MLAILQSGALARIFVGIIQIFNTQLEKDSFLLFRHSLVIACSLTQFWLAHNIARTYVGLYKYIILSLSVSRNNANRNRDNFQFSLYQYEFRLVLCFLWLNRASTDWKHYLRGGVDKVQRFHGPHRRLDFTPERQS